MKRRLAKLENAWRTRCARRAGAQIGRDVTLGRHVRIGAGVKIGDRTEIQDGVAIHGSVVIGRGCRIEKLVEISGNVAIDNDTVIGGYSYLSTMPTGRVLIGRDVLVNAYSVIGASERVEIGDHCIFAAYVHITDATHGFTEPEKLIKHAPCSAEPVFIDKNVWLGSAVMIMMGSFIGAGSVIGAKSLVNSAIPPMSIAYGIPARVVRQRNTEEMEK